MQVSTSISEVFGIQTRLLTHFLVAAFGYKPGSYSCNRDKMVHKASDIYSPSFTERKFAADLDTLVLSITVNLQTCSKIFYL